MKALLAMTTAHRRTLISVALAGLTLSGSGAFYGILVERPAAPTAEHTITLEEAAGAGLAAGVPLVDTDHDGLPDIVENYVYGSDPTNWSTAKSAIPDGWLARWGYPVTEAGIGSRPAGLPVGETLPAVYEGEWPSRWHLTLLQVYTWRRPATWNEARDGPFDNGLDPRAWDNSGLGIPDGWLLAHGLDPAQPGIGDVRAEDGGLTVREEFELGTNPKLADTDGDGLGDADEARLYHTDPRRIDTAGLGVPDGWLVGYGLNATDPAIVLQDPAGKGMTIEEVFSYNVERFGREAAIAGAGLSPVRTATLEGNVPDGWLVRYGLDPLEPGGDRLVRWRAADDPESSRRVIAGGGAPALPDLQWSYLDKYAYARPADWTEARDGPWWGGLRPDTNDTDGDGLSDVLEVRGWHMERRTSVDPNGPADKVRVTANPLLNDTDDDDLADREEFLGTARRGDTDYRFAPSDPANLDSGFSGLKDGEKVFGILRDGILYRFPAGGLNLTRADSNGSLLRDGPQLDYWHQRFLRYAAGGDYEYPGSHYDRIEDWLAGPPAPRESLAARFRPDGDLDGDGAPNLLDPDADGDDLLDGPELDPSLLRLRGPFAQPEAVGIVPRPATDPANGDTDGDGLADAWEVKHGLWVEVDDLWNLDPTKLSSFDDEVSDADRNLDEDLVTWWRFAQAPGGRYDREERSFDFNNLQEFEAKTNPNSADQDFDGVPEGWRRFWGTLYPTLATDPAEAGDLRPALLEPGLVQSIGNIAAGTLEDLLLGDYDYVRFQESSLPTAAGLVPPARRGEEVTVITVGGERFPVLRNGNLDTAYIAVIRGTFDLTALVASRLGTNPYLSDTDGDALSDAWEAFYDCVTELGVPTPDPVLHDADLDPDADGLTNREERDLGTDPCNSDTDQGGLDDLAELQLAGGSDPLEPTDDAAVLSDETDSDGDGLTDSKEILTARTDPSDPDTDGDGLLDGGDDEGGDLVLTEPAESARIARFLEAGIGHRVSGAAGSRSYRFYSETTYGTSPRVPESGVPGVPDGWLQYYGLVPNQVPAADRARLRQLYETGRPTWWDLADHGVWWWGLDPFRSPADPADLDRDGLHDANGEDPVPYASHNNSHLQSPSDRAQAQRRGDCAGDPRACRAAYDSMDYDGNGLPDWRARAPVAFQLDPVPPVAYKGENAYLEGRLVVACDSLFPCSAPPSPANRPVLVQSLEGARPVLGVGTTGPDGRFNVSFCYCAARSLELDSAVGIPILGRIDGPFSLPGDGALLSLGGGHRLRVLTLNTTATLFGRHGTEDAAHPQRLPIYDGADLRALATAAATGIAPGTIELRSRSQIRIVLQEPVFVVGSRVTGRVHLEDASGIPIGGTPSATWTVGAATRPVSLSPTAEPGVFAFEFPADVPGPAQYRLHVTFAGRAGVTPSTAAADIPIRFPTALDASVVGGGTTAPAASLVRIRGVLRTAAGPVSGASVEFGEGSNLLGTALTSAAGTFEALVLPSTTSAGDIEIQVAYRGSLVHGANAMLLPLRLRESTTILMTLPSGGYELGRPLPLTGRLLRVPSMTPLAGAAVNVSIDGTRLGASMTGADGTFLLTAPFPPELEPGTHSVRFAFGGSSLFESAEAEQAAAFATGTRVLLSPQTIAAGAGGSLKGRLVSADGRALAGQPVRAFWNGDEVPAGLTAYDGSFAIHVPAALVPQVGPATFRALFEADPTGLLLGSESEVACSVKAATRLLLPVGNATRTSFPLAGWLLTQAGLPVPLVPVTLRVGDEELQATTAQDGSFQQALSRPLRAEVGPFAWRARFAGDEWHAPSDALGVNVVHSSTRLELVTPANASMGQRIFVSAMLLQDDGRPAPSIPTGLLEFDGVVVGRVRDRTLPATLALDLPALASLGRHTIRLSFPGNETLQASSASQTIEIKEPAQIELTMGRGPFRPHEPVTVQVRVLGPDGLPVARRTIGIASNSVSLPFEVATDEEGRAVATVPAPEAGDLRVQATFLGTERIAAATAQASARVASAGTLAAAAAAAAPALVPYFALGGFLFLAMLATALLAGRPDRLLLQSLDEMLRRFEAPNPSAAGILVAYERLSRFVARHGFRERPGETAREFLGALSKAVPLERQDLEALGFLFDRARYGDAERLGPKDRLRGGIALRRLRDGVEQFVSARRAGGGAP